MEKQEIIDAFHQYRDRLQGYADRYGDNCEKLYAQTRKAVDRTELCVRSDMELGYYSPSPVLDLIIGNMHRGNILRQPSRLSKPTHSYGFDQDDRLVSFEKCAFEEAPDENPHGFVRYDKNRAVYVCFQVIEGAVDIIWIAETEFDEKGMLIRYIKGEFFFNVCKRVWQEAYTYGVDGMREVQLWECSAGSIMQHRYGVLHDGDGLVTGFASLDDDLWKGHVFEVVPGKRRRI